MYDPVNPNKASLEDKAKLKLLKHFQYLGGSSKPNLTSSQKWLLNKSADDPSEKERPYPNDLPMLNTDGSMERMLNSDSSIQKLGDHASIKQGEGLSVKDNSYISPVSSRPYLI